MRREGKPDPQCLRLLCRASIAHLHIPSGKKSTVDGSINGGRWIDWLAVAPHPLIPAFAEKFVGLLDQRFTLRPHLRRLRGKKCRPSRALSQAPFSEPCGRPLRKGRGVMLRRHPDIQPQTKSECGLGHIEARPAPILFKSAGALLACIVQKPLPDVLPDCVGFRKPCSTRHTWRFK
jgi:hypothetical protein